MMGVNHATRVRGGNLLAERPTREAERQRSGVARDSGWTRPLTDPQYRESASLRVLL